MIDQPRPEQHCQHSPKDRDNRRLHRSTPQSVCTRCGAFFTHHRDGVITVEMRR